MKVLHNICYGGFGLSNLAIDAFAKRKGINLTWYKTERIGIGNDAKYTRVEKVVNSESIFRDLKPFTKDLGKTPKDPDGKLFYYPDFYKDETRSDPDLIAVVEELGLDEASAPLSELAIEEIPDGASYDIDEYDGMESVLPARPSSFI